MVCLPFSIGRGVGKNRAAGRTGFSLATNLSSADATHLASTTTGATMLGAIANGISAKRGVYGVTTAATLQAPGGTA